MDAGGKPSVLSVSAPRLSKASNNGLRGLFRSISSPSIFTFIPREESIGRDKYSVVPLFPASIFSSSISKKAEVASSVMLQSSSIITSAPIALTALIQDSVSSEIRGCLMYETPREKTEMRRALIVWLLDDGIVIFPLSFTEGTFMPSLYAKRKDK